MSAAYAVPYICAAEYVPFVPNMCCICMCDICPIYVPYVCLMCALYVLYMCHVYAVYVPYICRISAVYVPGICRICAVYVTGMCSILFQSVKQIEPVVGSECGRKGELITLSQNISPLAPLGPSIPWPTHMKPNF